MRLGAVDGTTVDNPCRADAADYDYADNLRRCGVDSRGVLTQHAAPAPDAVRLPGLSAVFGGLFADARPSLGILKRISVRQGSASC